MGLSDFALNPFRKGKKTEVEGVRKVEIVNSGLEKHLKVYEKIPENDKEDYYRGYFDALDLEVLSPNEITKLSSYIICNGMFKGLGSMPYISHKDSLTSFFFNHLIQESYDVGNNDFVIHSQDVGLTALASYLTGEEDNKLNLTVYGSLKDMVARNSCHINLAVHGNVGENLGFVSKNCKLSVYGSIKTNSDMRSRNSLYQTTDKISYEKLIDKIDGINNIQLIDAKGNVIGGGKSEYKNFP